jgi:hypothetical protein
LTLGGYYASVTETINYFRFAMDFLRRLFGGFLPLALLVITLVIGGYSISHSQVSLAQSMPLTTAVNQIDSPWLLTESISNQSRLAKQNPRDNINYKDLAQDTVQILKWLEQKDMTATSFICSFAGYGTDCVDGFFMSLGRDPESALLGLKGSKYINTVNFRIDTREGKDLIPSYVDIIPKESYRKLFSVQRFYKELVNREVSYQERIRRLPCQEIRRDLCPKTRMYSADVRDKYFPNASTSSNYQVSISEDVTRGRRQSFSFRIMLH